MKKLDYRYHLDDSVLVIEDLLGGESVFMSIDKVLAQIEAETGLLQDQHILWKGQDNLWDLLLPEAKRVQGEMAFYPIGTRTLEEAKAHLAQLVAEGLVPGIIS